MRHAALTVAVCLALAPALSLADPAAAKPVPASVLAKSVEIPFETFTLDWEHRQLPPPAPITIASLQAWFAAQDEAMNGALSRFTDDELQIDRIDRGHGFIASPFVQHQIYREAVYISYGKLSVYLKALERDAGEEWASWVG